MNRSTDAQQLWDALLMAHPRRTRFTLQHLLGTFQQVFPHRHGDTDVRAVLTRLLGELEKTGAVRLPSKANRRAYDYSERTALPKHIIRSDRPSRVKQTSIVWRPELAFASEIGPSWEAELLAVQEWLRNGGAAAASVALRERSVEIFGDEKRLDSLLGTQLFAPGRLSLDLLRCYLPSVPVYVVSVPEDGLLRPLLVVENHTTFDTLCRWNEKNRRYSAVAFGAGAAFIAACESLRPSLAAPGCSGRLLYFGDVDPKGLWIPARASEDCGIEVHPDETLYTLLLAKGRKRRVIAHDPLAFESELLDWLPATLRDEVGRHFRSGRRLPQELVALPDLLLAGCQQTTQPSST
ncbi:MAG TPA: hypothetical protein P5525_23600 [Candidatus Paceibacterota bacterium]|nr:hypothetical protein [Candidatus Paceibacterota bacterium]